MAKNKTRATLSSDEKLYRAARGLFILMARQVDMGNKEMREVLGGDQAEIDAVAKVVNRALRKRKIVE